MSKGLQCGSHWPNNDGGIWCWHNTIRITPEDCKTCERVNNTTTLKGGDTYAKHKEADHGRLDRV